jgi:very-short-patch-repair endonuclease
VQRATLRHRALLLEVLADVEAGATTPLEQRALRRVFGAHGLGVRLQYRPGGGNRIVDAAIVEFGILIELDGRVGHVEEGAFRDRVRDNAHVLDGWITLRFGWFDIIADPCAVAAQIAALMRQRGWSGALRRCPDC